MFNYDDYSENVEYCKYIYDLLLTMPKIEVNPDDVQRIANTYVDFLDEKGIDTDSDIVMNEKIAKKAISHYLRRLRNNVKERFNEEDANDMYEYEKEYFARSGHNRVDDDFDDKTVEQLQEQFYEKHR